MRVAALSQYIVGTIVFGSVSQQMLGGRNSCEGAAANDKIRRRKREGGKIGQDNEQDGSAESKAGRSGIQPGRTGKKSWRGETCGSCEASKSSCQTSYGRSEKRSRKTVGCQGLEARRIEAGNEDYGQARSKICNSQAGREGRVHEISREARRIQAAGRQSRGVQAGWQNFREACIDQVNIGQAGCKGCRKTHGKGSDLQGFWQGGGKAGRQGQIEARNAEGDVRPAYRRRQALA